MTDVTTKQVTKSADSIVSREVRGEETDLLKVPISSTRADRDGDEFSRSALDDMASQIKREQPKVFQNHGFTDFYSPLYDDRETIGTHMDAEVETEKDDEDDATLYAFILPDETHPEGERLKAQVEAGHAEKFSVGFRVHEASPKNPESENDERRIFEEVDHMETSKVGIPSNPDASAAVAMKAAGLSEQFAAGDVDIDDPAAFASMLAGELVRRSGPVTRADVDAATPTQVDGHPERVTRNESMARKETKEECDVDTDCPEGEVCIEGECVPEDDVDDDDDDEEESASTSPDEATVRQIVREELNAALGDGDGTDTDGVTNDDEPTITLGGEEFTVDEVTEQLEAEGVADSQTSTTSGGSDTTADDADTDKASGGPDETNDASGANGRDSGSGSLQEMIHE